MEGDDAEFPLSNGPNTKRDDFHGHDRNLSLPSNTSPREPPSRPSRAATYSRASGQIRRPQPVTTESAPGVPQQHHTFDQRPQDGFIYQGAAITSPPEGITIPEYDEQPTHGGPATPPAPPASAPPVTDNTSNMDYKSKTDPKTPSEYALHILFTQFVRCAERKLNQCLGYATESEPRIAEILGQGVDPHFDKIIASLGYIARRKPKPVIDSVMFWRKSKSEAANQAAQQAGPSTAAHSRSGSRQDAVDPRQVAVQADRKSWISIFILCRVLMEVVRQTPTDVLGVDLCEKLEEIVFRQLKTAEPDMISVSLIRRANWNLFAELLGEMSDSRFESVSDKFVAELEKVPATLGRERESATQLVIQGMKYLKLTLYPMDMLEESANFLESLVKFFAHAQNQTIKLAYSEVIPQILLPIAGVATAELNHPTWVQAMDSLYNRSLDMMNKTKHWQSAFTLATTALSVAPQELFSNNWLQLYENNLSRIKERSNRPCFYTGTARLLWVFMCRCTESLNNTTRKLETVSKSLLAASGKKAWVLPDPKVNPACITLIRIAAYGYRQFVLENVLFQLITGSNSQDISSLDNITPERAIVSIRSFVEILADVELNYKPPFPTDEVLSQMYNDPRSPEPARPRALTGALKEFYDKFGALLFKILTMCDAQFGASGSVAEEKQSQQRPPMPFHFGNESSSQAQKQMLIDLFCVVMESMSWCLLPNFYNKGVEILCRNSIHSSPRIANAASRALKSLAKTLDTQGILNVVAKHLFAFDERFFMTYTPCATARGDYEKLLRLYADLLEGWTERIKNDINNSSYDDDDKRSDDAIVHGLWPFMQEVEGNGLYFLCSPERGIRHLAIKVLRLTAKFDTVMKEHEEQHDKDSSHSHKSSRDSGPPARLITYLETVDMAELFERAKPEVILSMPERTRLSKLMSVKKKEALVKVADSEHGIDSALWLKAFPTFMKECFEHYPMPVAIARNTICFRLVGMHDVVTEFMRTEDPKHTNHEFLAKHSTRTHPEVVVEQWRIYLVVACLALTLTDEQKLHIPDRQANHGRKKSTQKITIHHQKITSIKSVFRMVIPLLGVDHPVIRDAIVTGISCINVNTYQALLECMKPAIQNWKSESRQPRYPGAGVRRDPNTGYRQDRIITEIAHVFRVTAYYFDDPMIHDNEYAVKELLEFLGDLRSFLAAPNVQTSWEYQKLRRYFCGIVEKVVEGVSKSQLADKMLTFETRLSFYNLIEEWCDFGASHALARDRDAIIKQAAFAGAKDSREQNVIEAAMELEKQKFEIAVLTALSALCNGPIVKEVENNAELRTMSFKLDGILKWVNAVMQDRDDLQVIGQRALNNLLHSNPQNTRLFDEAIANCYRIDNGRGDGDAKLSRNYFKTLADVVLSDTQSPCEVRQILTVGLLKTGDDDFEVRSYAVKLLRATELRFFEQTCMNEFEARALSRSPPIYKRVLFDLSARFAQDHPGESPMILSEIFMYFHKVGDIYRRDILSVLLPWVQSVELEVELPNEQLSPASMMVLNNLLEITIGFSDRISNEVEALWVAVISGISANLKIVMDYLFRQSMSRPDAAFVHYARKIILYMSTYQKQVISEALIRYLSPKYMIPRHPEPYTATEARKMYPHVAEVSELLPVRMKESAFSEGQLAMIMLVDLLMSPDEVIKAQLPMLLHSSLVLMDHYLPVVHDQAREMLVLILIGYTQRSDERVALCDQLRQKDRTMVWAYEDLNSDKDGAQTPAAMNKLVSAVLDQFDNNLPEVRKVWARVALNWATACPVRHIACRSFQIFRCLLSYLDQNMLADMLARLSNTIADSGSDIQGFSMQILMTLNAVTAELASEELINYPQLFWASVACMSTTNEQEYIEVLSVLEKFLSKIDLDSPETVACLISTFPPKWEGKFEGLQHSVMVGLRSSNSWEQSSHVLDKLNQLNSNELIAPNADRLVMALCASMPRYLHELQSGQPMSAETEASCNRLREICDEEEYSGLSRILTSLVKGRFRTKKDFMHQTMQSIRTNFFPQYEVPVLSFFLSILSNKLRWVKEESMEMLKLIFPVVDMQREELAGVGADLISPLLRLLQTDFAEQALSVLDETASISSSKMDKHVLRMSLGNKTLRKEYEKTYTMFGIPDDSGWAVPMTAVAKDLTRNNVHAVFYTCASANSPNQDVDDEFQFHKEEGFGYSLHPTESVSVEGSMNQMWTALDNLDSFFATNNMRRRAHGNNGANQANAHGHMHSLSVTDTDASADNVIEPVESAPQLYDKKVSIILNRSLARTPSTTSFNTSLADSFAGNMSQDMRNHLRHMPSSSSSRRREIVDFGQDLGDISGSSDGDDEHNDDDRSYNSFDTVRYGDATTSSSASPYGQSSPSNARPYQQHYPSTPQQYQQTMSPRGYAYDQASPPSAPNTPPQQPAPRKASQPAESSFRLESLLKGASSIGKKKKPKDASKKSKKGGSGNRDSNSGGNQSATSGEEDRKSGKKGIEQQYTDNSPSSPPPRNTTTSPSSSAANLNNANSNAGAFQFPPPMRSSSGQQ